ncbi:MAG: methylenetetrahydrofolate reductase C-terminal domain-containing protein [Anaerolineales bacterium]
MSIRRWLQDHPYWLESAFQAANWAFRRLMPVISRLGYERIDRWLRGPEEFGKKLIFDCRMCGQCVLHATGMTCPMTCPKNLRNGPCGGVRPGGYCEVIQDMKCVWIEAVERSQKMVVFGNEIIRIQPPLNQQLEGSSAWINLLTGEDRNLPQGWAYFLKKPGDDPGRSTE